MYRLIGPADTSSSAEHASYGVDQCLNIIVTIQIKRIDSVLPALPTRLNPLRLLQLCRHFPCEQVQITAESFGSFRAIILTGADRECCTALISPFAMGVHARSGVPPTCT